MSVMDARRRLYGRKDGTGCAFSLARLSLETGLEQSVCVERIEPTLLLALSPDAMMLAGIQRGSELAVLAVDDPAWSVGESSRVSTYAIGRSPVLEAGAPARLTRGVFIDPEITLFVGQGYPRDAISVRYERGDGGSFTSTYRLDPRLSEFLDVAPSGDGGVWALGVDVAKRAYLVKLTASNTLDTSAAGGMIEIDPGPVYVASLGVDAAGRAVALLHSPSGPARVVRVLPSGLVDPSYGSQGRIILPVGGHGRPDTRALVGERSGGVLVGGPVLEEDGGSRHVGVVRVDADGRLDPAFGGANAPFLLQPGASTIENLTDPGEASLVAAPALTAAPGCEPEFAVGFGQRDGGVYLFQ